MGRSRPGVHPDSLRLSKPRRFLTPCDTALARPRPGVWPRTRPTLHCSETPFAVLHRNQFRNNMLGRESPPYPAGACPHACGRPFRADGVAAAVPGFHPRLGQAAAPSAPGQVRPMPSFDIRSSTWIRVPDEASARSRDILRFPCGTGAPAHVPCPQTKPLARERFPATRRIPEARGEGLRWGTKVGERRTRDHGPRTKDRHPASRIAHRASRITHHPAEPRRGGVQRRLLPTGHRPPIPARVGAEV